MVKNKDQINKLLGWLEPRAIDLFEFIGKAQERLNIKGDILEIGTYYGKSTCVLGQLLNRAEKIYANDTFIGYTKTEDFLRNFKENFNKLCPGKQIQIFKCVSEELWNMQIGKCRIAHIDGEHSYEVTMNDFILANKLLTDDGLIIADDFLNQDWLGVSMAVNKFLTYFPYAPVAIGYNKFIMCKKEYYQRYFDFLSKASMPISPHNYLPFFGFKYISFK